MPSLDNWPIKSSDWFGYEVTKMPSKSPFLMELIISELNRRFSPKEAIAILTPAAARRALSARKYCS
jgi:hypothetical protein